jgi:hypothetical protein
MKLQTPVIAILLTSLIAQPKHPASAAPSSFMGVRFGIPIEKQFQPCPTNGDYLPDGARCFEDSFVRWENEAGNPIQVETDEKTHAVWYVTRDFPDDEFRDVVSDLKAKYGVPDCDVKHASPAVFCSWNTRWGLISLRWGGGALKVSEAVTVSGGSNAYYAHLKRQQDREAAKRQKNNRF